MPKSLIIPSEPLEAAMRMFRIPDRYGIVVPFRLNDAQTKYHNNRSLFDVIYKSRQFGFSSYLELEAVIQCARYEQQHAVVIAHDRESTQRLFARTKFFLEDVARLGVEIPYRHYTKNEIVFKETNSTFYVGTAGSRKFGRGDTINFLHCSEVAFWPNPIETMGGLVPAAKYGRKVLESTANGKGNYFHRMCGKGLVAAAEEVNDGFSKLVVRPRLHFYPWHEFAEYQIPGDYSMQDLTLAEIELVKTFNLTLPQVAWMRQTRLEMPDDLLFPQEYPMTYDEGFLSSGGGVLPNAKLTKSAAERVAGLVVYEAPQFEKRYVAGIDCGGGTRRDYSVVEIFDAVSLEQVAELAVNDVSPKTFAKRAVALCKRYKAFVVPEVQFGMIVLDVLKDEYPTHLIYKRFKPDKMKYQEKQELYGLYATEQSKQRIVAKGREAVDEGAIFHSEFLVDQMDSFIETPEGKLQAEQGCHDDAVIAFCCAIEGLSQMRLPIYKPESKPKVNDTFEGYTFKAIRDRILRSHQREQHL